MKKRVLISFSIILFVLILDQTIKIWTKNTFVYGDLPVDLIGSWFRLLYVENQGMAFGTTIGSGSWGKLVLSIFRIIVVTGIVYYIFRLAKSKDKIVLIVGISMILAGAFGNIIDSMIYDYIFSFDPTMVFNMILDSDGSVMLDSEGNPVIRETGFLYANVVDMFQFYGNWPSWMPFVGGQQIFPAVWNVADASITCGVVVIIIGNIPLKKSKKHQK